jgi:regulator of sigma E protease
MIILLTILAFIVILGLLVFVHELGHFVVAKKSGMKVEEFGFGFPPKIFGIKKGETTYSINLIPLGGFVKIVGEDGSDALDPQSFGNKPAWKRFLVLIAGVTMNVILAWILISIGMAVGLPTALSQSDSLPKSARLRDVAVGILEVQPGTPADQAGLKLGDLIVKIDNQNIATIQQAQDATKQDAGKAAVYTIKRGQQTLQKTITPRANPPAGEGPLGIALGSVGFVSYPWYEAPIRGFTATVNVIVLTVTTFAGIIWQFVQGHHVGAALSGPVGIAVLTRDVTQLGFIYLLQFTAILSINLAIINAIPFPALDGGRILFLVIEKLRGRKMDVRAESWANTIGFMLLILLMIAVTVKDVSHYSQGFKHLFQKIF